MRINVAALVSDNASPSVIPNPIIGGTLVTALSPIVLSGNLYMVEVQVAFLDADTHSMSITIPFARVRAMSSAEAVSRYLLQVMQEMLFRALGPHHQRSHNILKPEIAFKI